MSIPLRMPNVNYIIISGHLTMDPDLRYTSEGTPLLKFQIANNRNYKDRDGNWQKQTSFQRVTLWGSQVERLSSLLKKGSPVLVEGSLESRSYIDKQDNKRTAVDIRARRVQYLEKLPIDEKVQEEGLAEPNSNADEEEKSVDDVPF